MECEISSSTSEVATAPICQIWAAIELWDFGMLSIFLSGMQVQDVQNIAMKYGIARWELLTSWVRAINHIRNICAHHSRPLEPLAGRSAKAAKTW